MKDAIRLLKYRLLQLEEERRDVCEELAYRYSKGGEEEYEKLSAEIDDIRRSLFEYEYRR